MWAKLDDRAPTNPKFFAAGVSAFGLFAQGLCYCAANLTDGFIPAAALPLVSPGTAPRVAAALIEKLVTVGAWEVVTDGWRVHDYLDYNPSRAAVLAEREVARKRKEAWNAKRNGVRTPTERQEELIPDADGTADERREERCIVPSRPVPSRPTTLSHTSRESATNTRFQIPTSIEEALGKCPLVGGARKAFEADWWQAEIRANVGVNFARELRIAEAWLTSRRERVPKKAKGWRMFLHNWFGRADRAE